MVFPKVHQETHTENTPYIAFGQKHQTERHLSNLFVGHLACYMPKQSGHHRYRIAKEAIRFFRS